MKKIKDVLSKIKEKYNKSVNTLIKKINFKKKQEKSNNKKINYKDLTISSIEQELKREKYKSKYKKVLASTIYTLIIVISLAVIVAMLVMPVLQISGSSMTPTLTEGEIVVTVKTKKLAVGDVVAFYHGNKILIKRVIAGPNSWVNITDEGDVYINNKLIDEPYVSKKHLGKTDIDLPYQVPEETYFILGDERETSIDSRTSEIGALKQEDIIGKVIFRVWPLKKIGSIN